jgi:hypothetical protein
MSQRIAAAFLAFICAQTALAQPASLAIMIKEGVDMSGVQQPMLDTFPAVIATWTFCEAGQPVITSGVDSMSAHRKGSAHGYGNALDWRGRSHDSKTVACIQRELPKRLPDVTAAGARYVLIWETPATHKTNAPHWHLGYVPGPSGGENNVLAMR